MSELTTFHPPQPFLVKRNKCVAGVMVTASHNPKEDNGFKVYWANAAQVIRCSRAPHSSHSLLTCSNTAPSDHQAP